MISINAKELVDVVKYTPAHQNILLVGRHGIGKSEILTEYYGELGIPVVTLFLGQMSDPGDIIGLPTRDGERTSFLPPYWWPVDGKPIVLFLDELNRARPEVLQSVMDLTLNRRLAGRALPSGSRIIAAVNDGEDYQLTDLDPALVSRFNVYRFAPTVGDWLQWAEANGVDKRVLNFIASDNAMLDGDGCTIENISSLDRTPDRRAWKRVSDIVAGMPDLSVRSAAKIIAGVVGSEAASRFMASVQVDHLPTGEDVIMHFDEVKSTLERCKIHEAVQINDSIFRFLDNSKMDTDISSLMNYMQILNDYDNKEAIAHFASLFSGGEYPNAVGLIVGKQPKVYEMLVDYIANL